MLLVTGGRLGDIYGRRRVFLSGMVGFGCCSLLCGLAPSALWLVVGRVVQGGFAAILMPQSLAMIRFLFPAHERPRAMGLYAATFGIGSVAGQLLGGVLIAINPWDLGWRSIFLVNLPIIALIVPAAAFLLRESRDSESSRLDLGGVLLLAASLSALIIPLVEGREQAWPAWSWWALGSSLPLLYAFWQYQKRLAARGGSPLLPPALAQIPGLLRGLLAALLFHSLAVFFLLFSIYQQVVLARSPLQAGLSIMPMAIGFALSPLLSHYWLAWLGRRAPGMALVVLSAGMFATALATVAGQAAWLPATVFICGLGQGLSLPTLVRSLVERIGAQWAGLAAGVVNSVLQIGAVLSVTLIGGLFYLLLAGRAEAVAVAHAFSVAVFTISAAVLCAAWLMTGMDRGPATATPVSSHHE